MNLKPETLEKLRVLLKEDWGQDVSDQELHDIAFNLLGYYDTLLQWYCEDLIEDQKQENLCETTPSKS